MGEGGPSVGDELRAAFAAARLADLRTASDTLRRITAIAEDRRDLIRSGAGHHVPAREDLIRSLLEGLSVEQVTDVVTLAADELVLLRARPR